jgi:hypothetical protein
VLYNERRLSARGVRQIAFLGLAPLVFAGWFYLRSLVLWDAVFPDDRFFPLNPLPIWDEAYRTVFPGDMRNSFWYVGGAFNVRLDPIVYDLLDLTAALSLAGLIVTYVQRRLDQFEKLATLLLLALPLLALTTVLYFSVDHDFQTQARYLYVAMPSFAIALPLGLGALFTRRQGDHAVMLFLPAVLVVINIALLTTTLPRTY